MFEDIKKNDENVTAGNPSAVEDMFGKVDPTPDIKSAVQSGKLTPVASSMAAPQPPMPQAPMGTKIGPPNPLTNLSQLDQWSKKPARRSMRMILIVVAALIVVGAAIAYFFFMTPTEGSNATAKNTTANTNATTNTDTTANAQPTPPPTANENGNQAPSIPSNALIDSDGDGLTDVEEAVAGTDPHLADTDNDGLNDRDELYVHKTNPLLADSDNDGLSDRDEIFTYKTNPMNPDTDGDTYQDGVEVQNGYNPNGPGKLPPTETPPNAPIDPAPTPAPAPTPSPAPTPTPAPAPAQYTY